MMNEKKDPKIKMIDIVPADAYPNKRFQRYEVHVDKLSKPAKELVRGILTTNNWDDLSEVFVIMPLTNLEIAELNGTEHCFDPSNPMRISPKEDGACDYDSSAPNCRFCARWSFDAIKNYETPEAYFERQIDTMRKYGYTEFVTSFPGFVEARTGKGKKHSLYESSEEREKAVLDYIEKIKAVGRITAKMESKGTSFNGRVFFVGKAYSQIFPYYYMRPIPDSVLASLENLANEMIPYYRKGKN